MQAALLGTGLIGSSVGIGLRALGWMVKGWDPDQAALEGAVAVGAVDQMAAHQEAALAEVDLVVLAGPPSEIESTLRNLSTRALVTDVAGVKLPMVEAGAHLERFVGGHPMAGRETSGPAGASGSLFRGASWILTTDGVEAGPLDFMAELVSALGAVPVRMAAADHDAAVAAVSHLPQVVASALVNRVARHPLALDLAAGGFRDLTRIALSDPAWWSDVLVENRLTLVPLLRELAEDLGRWAGRLEASDREQVGGELLAARTARGSLAAPVAAVGVVLDDRPGEIARVGHALETSGVDLRDLQLRHATHGGGGVLTLSVRAAEAETLRQALIGEGLRLLD
ncbi:MAG TPA: prephenate dehydrogenase/arogenate dehydrogenase family protein [Acidimicrobiia bacterium]|nr:prephenate dehydrogenase/arogenate dehydrogenase family protein [Acidimicrobiia bacterium]